MRTLVLLATAFLVAFAAPAQAHLLLPTDQGLPPLGLKHHRVEIDVKDGTAVTTIEQVYVNSTSRQLEATYIFPLPDGAVVIDFELMVNGVMKKGEVLEKGKANQIYSEIVRRMRDPGIVDWMGRGLFKARIYPIPPRGEQKLKITYSQVLPFLDGTYHLSYPLKTPQQTVSTLEDFTLTARINHRIPIKNVYSPSHKISTSLPDDHKAIIGFEGDSVSLDKDFSLYFGVSKKDVGLNLLTHRLEGEAGYFMLMASPKAVFDSSEIQGKAITFVLDTSGSMTGLKLEQAKKALKWSLDHLGHDDRFNVIRFSSDVETFEPTLVSASDANKKRAQDFVDTFEAAGGTAINDALKKALSARVKQGPHLVLFITDGRPTVGETTPKAILDAVKQGNQGAARILALGIGDDVHTHLLDQVADKNGGTSAYVKPTEDMDTHIAALYNQIAYPVLTDVGLDISKVKVYAAQPGKLPDIFKGGQLLVVGRYRGDGDALIKLTGQMGQMSRSFDFEGTFPKSRAENSFITSLWAHRQVGFLLDQIRLNGETSELKAEVIQLAKKYGIVTPYTSYLVVEDNVVSRPGQPRPEPLPRPIRPRVRHDRRADGLGSGGSAPTASTPPPAKMAPPTDAEDERVLLELSKNAELSRDKSGKGAVDTAKAVRGMKEKKQAGSGVASVKYASGKVFSWRGGVWVDNANKAGLTEIRVAPYSDGWIALVKALPKLKQALALGENVTIVLGRYVIKVAPGGAKTIDAKVLKALKKQ